MVFILGVSTKYNQSFQKKKRKMKLVQKCLPADYTEKLAVVKEATYQKVADAIQQNGATDYGYVIRAVNALIQCKLHPSLEQRLAIVEYLAAQLPLRTENSAELVAGFKLLPVLLRTQLSPAAPFRALYKVDHAPFLALVDKLLIRKHGDPTNSTKALVPYFSRMMTFMSNFWASPEAVCCEVIERYNKHIDTRHRLVVAVMYGMLPVRHLTQEQVDVLMKTSVHVHGDTATYIFLFCTRLLRAELSRGSVLPLPLASLYPWRQQLYHQYSVIQPQDVNDPLVCRISLLLARLEHDRDGDLTRIVRRLANNTTGGREKAVATMCKELYTMVLNRVGINETAAGGEDEDDSDEEKEEEEEEEEDGEASHKEKLRAFGAEVVALLVPLVKLCTLVAPKASVHAAVAMRYLLLIDNTLLQDMITVAQTSMSVNTAKVGSPAKLLEVLAPFIFVHGTEDNVAWLLPQVLDHLDPANKSRHISRALRVAEFVCAYTPLDTPQLRDWGLAVFDKILQLSERKIVTPETQAFTACLSKLLWALDEEGVRVCCQRITDVIDTGMCEDEYSSPLRCFTEVALACADRDGEWAFRTVQGLLERTKRELGSSRPSLAWPCSFLFQMLSHIPAVDGCFDFVRECASVGDALMRHDQGKEAWRVNLGGMLFAGSVLPLFTICGIGIATRDWGPTPTPLQTITSSSIEWTTSDPVQAKAGFAVMVELYNKYMGTFVAGAEKEEGHGLAVFSAYLNGFSVLLLLLREPQCGLATHIPSLYCTNDRSVLDTSGVLVSWDDVLRTATHLADAHATDDFKSTLVVNVSRVLTHFVLGLDGNEMPYSQKALLQVVKGLFPRKQHLRTVVSRHAYYYTVVCLSKLSILQTPSEIEHALFKKLVSSCVASTTKTQNDAISLVDTIYGACPNGYRIADVVDVCVDAYHSNPQDKRTLRGVFSVLTQSNVRGHLWEGAVNTKGLVTIALEAAHHTDEEDVRKPLDAFLDGLFASHQPQTLCDLSAGEIFSGALSSSNKDRAARVLSGLCLRVRSADVYGNVAGQVFAQLLAGFISENTSVRQRSGVALRAFFFINRGLLEGLKETLLSVCSVHWLSSALALNRENLYTKAQECRDATHVASGMNMRVWKHIFLCAGDDLVERIEGLGIVANEANCCTVFEIVGGLLKSLKHNSTETAVAFAGSVLRAAKESGEQQVQFDLCAAVAFGGRGVRNNSFIADFVKSYLTSCRGLQGRLALLRICTYYVKSVCSEVPEHLAALVEILSGVAERQSLVENTACHERYAEFLKDCIYKAARTTAEGEVVAVVSGLFEEFDDDSAELLLHIAGTQKVLNIHPFIPRIQEAALKLATERRAFADDATQRLIPLISRAVRCVLGRPECLDHMLAKLDSVSKDVLHLRKGKVLTMEVLTMTCCLSLQIMATKDAAADHLESILNKVVAQTADLSYMKCVVAAFASLTVGVKEELLSNYIVLAKDDTVAKRKIAVRCLGAIALADMYRPSSCAFGALRELIVLSADPEQQVSKLAHQALAVWRIMLKEKPVVWDQLSGLLETEGVLVGVNTATDFSTAFS